MACFFFFSPTLKSSLSAAIISSRRRNSSSWCSYEESATKASWSLSTRRLLSARWIALRRPRGKILSRSIFFLPQEAQAIKDWSLDKCNPRVLKIALFSPFVPPSLIYCSRDGRRLPSSTDRFRRSVSKPLRLLGENKNSFIRFFYSQSAAVSPSIDSQKFVWLFFN